MFTSKVNLFYMTIIFTSLSTESFSFDREKEEKLEKCLQTCDQKSVTKQLKNGTFICGEFNGVLGPYDSCMSECLDGKQAKDQNQCFCDFCKQGEQYKLFCLEPKPDSIGKDECDSLVCTGLVKYHGGFCDPKLHKQLDEID